MDFITAKEAATLWGVSQRRVAILCAEERINGAQLVGNMWLIPKTSYKPNDARSVRFQPKSPAVVKPFLKWAGGKAQALGSIRMKYPAGLEKKIYKYAEPFVGGGAVLFDILSNYSMSEIYISDINRELMLAYLTIRDNVNELITCLKSFEDTYLPADEQERKDFYYCSRARFNDLKLSKSDSPELSALLILLNRTCFNGLYRVNSRGEFNVPQGTYKNPCICDEDNLYAVSRKLQDVQIICGDYTESREFIDENTFVYFDPPYRPLTATSRFTAYTQDGFGDKEQIELARFIDEISECGAYAVASNSDPRNADQNDSFFDDLYAKHHIFRISAARNINSAGNGRGRINELLIASNERSFHMRDFNKWLKKFKASISDYSYYVDFDKVHKNVDAIRIELNILNSLIGSKSIEDDFERVVLKYPETLKCVPTLLAVRGREIYAINSEGEFTYNFRNANYNIEQYKIFMQKTGLFDLMENHILSNLVDYVTGVETGLDSNGRKNRGGHLMENLVESYLCKAGLIKDETYFKEMSIGDIEARWGIDLSVLSNQGKTVKRFDFVVKTANEVFSIETNFYTGGGSKLNETAGSYKNIAVEAKGIKDFEFMWLTDGRGWTSARNNLEETFDVLTHLYCIDDLENGVLGRVFL